MQRRRAGTWTALLVALALLTPAPAGAQPPRDDAAGFPLADLIRPDPEDEGPVTPEEERELLQFARKHVPFVHGALAEMREASPERYRFRLETAAPRLRQLRRIFDREPALGRRILRYAENQQRIRTARRIWDESEERTPVLRRRLAAEVRPLMAENLRIELDVLDDRIRELTGERERAVDSEFRRLTREDADPAAQPDDVRELLRRYRASSDDAERAGLADRIREIGAQRVDDEVRLLRERAERMRSEAPREVDRRVGRAMDDRPEGERVRDRRPDRGPRRP